MVTAENLVINITSPYVYQHYDVPRHNTVNNLTRQKYLFSPSLNQVMQAAKYYPLA